MSNEGNVEIVIFDQSGNIVFSESIRNFKGNYSNMIDISAHADGAYFLQIMQNDKSYSKKILKSS